MNDDKGTTTLGKGFQKRQLVDTPQIAVNPDDITTMQRGYEIRLARQRDALTRMGERLEMLTRQVAEEMRKANEAAAKVREDDQGPMLSYEVTDGDVDELLKLIPEDWDLPGDNTPRSIIAGYIKHCRDEAERCKQTLAVHKEPIDRLIAALGNRARPGIIAGVPLDEIVMTLIVHGEQSLQESQRSLAQAITDARFNAKQANAVMRATQPDVGDIGDDTPPWEGGPKAYVAPVDLAASAGVPQPLQVGDDRETLSWDGASSLMLGEQRPGNSF